ncbi:MAG: hypothetical protein ACK4Y7_05760 [Caldimicrobium sp.]
MALNLKKLDLKFKYYLYLWGPFFILSFIMIYYPLKVLKYPQKSEITLPQEYGVILEYLKRLDVPKETKGELEITLKTNPFLEGVTLDQTTEEALPSAQVLNLTSILHTYTKACIINGKLYKEKDKIGKILISKIGDYYVELFLPNKKKVILEVGGTYTFSE